MDILKDYRDAFDLLYDSVLIVDQQMIIRYSNISANHTFSYSADEMNGSSIEMLVPDKFRGEHHAHTSMYSKDPKPRQMHIGKRLLARRKDGGEFPVSISLNPIQCESGIMFCAVVRDLSELVRIEDELLQKQKMESLGVLVGGVAHDINNIMAAISGSVYLARRKPEQSERHLKTIDAQCKYATDIVQQMLVISKDEGIETVDFSLSELLMSSKQLFRIAVSNSINITFNVDVKHAYVHGSPTLVTQAIINLILNAKDAVEMVESPAISVALEEVEHLSEECADGRYLCVSVADNGHGIDESAIGRIFEPFYTSKPSTKGTGLGLAIVYNVAQICGGYIDVESVVGKGAAFKLYLPMLDGAAMLSTDSKVVNNEDLEEVEDIGVLLVEDNKAVRRVNRDIIESIGYTTFSAKNGRAAVKKATLFKDEIGLIMMDISMPGMGGVEAALEIRKMDIHTPIIFCSGNRNFFSHIDRYAKRLHPFAMLAKPFDALRLANEIQNLILSSCEES